MDIESVPLRSENLSFCLKKRNRDISFTLDSQLLLYYTCIQYSTYTYMCMHMHAHAAYKIAVDQFVKIISCFFISVCYGNLENILTTNISRFTVAHKRNFVTHTCNSRMWKNIIVAFTSSKFGDYIYIQ